MHLGSRICGHQRWKLSVFDGRLYCLDLLTIIIEKIAKHIIPLKYTFDKVFDLRDERWWKIPTTMIKTFSLRETSKNMTCSDHLNEYVYNGLIHFVVLSTLISNDVKIRIHHLMFSLLRIIYQDFLIKYIKIILRLK